VSFRGGHGDRNERGVGEVDGCLAAYWRYAGDLQAHFTKIQYVASLLKRKNKNKLKYSIAACECQECRKELFYIG
jgi:hypothetical protein